MHLYIPTILLWLPAAIYLAVGMLVLPYIAVTVHRQMSHNQGWTWKTTLGMDKPVRGVFEILVTIVMWPSCLYAVRPRSWRIFP